MWQTVGSWSISLIKGIITGVYSPEWCSYKGVAGTGFRGRTKVCQLDQPLLGEQNVAGLNVTVDPFVRMEVDQTLWREGER